MIPGQLIAPGQLTDPKVNFASVHSLTPVTVHMSFNGGSRQNVDRVPSLENLTKNEIFVHFHSNLGILT